MLNHCQSIGKDKISNQQNLFNEANNVQLSINLFDIPDWGIEEKLNNEFSSLGLYLKSHPLDNYSEVLKSLDVKTNLHVLDNPQNFSNKNIQLCGLIFKLFKKQSSRGKWATILLNDLSGSSEINIYSDVFVKFEDVLVEKQLILVDAEIKNETNQGCKIIARRLTLLNDFISEKKFNLTLIMDNSNSMREIYDFSKTLVTGNSDLIIKIRFNGQAIKFIVRENIKISSEFISNITKVNDVRSISFT